MKKLSIVIPFMGQTAEELFIPLSSLNGQVGVDFEAFDVQMVNDGGPKIDKSSFGLLSNLTIVWHELEENVGMGMARQYGIDHSQSEYVMFVDSDDSLHLATALLEFFNVVGKADHELIFGSYVEEQKDIFVKHTGREQKMPWAKWYSRRFLEKNEIRFHSELRVFEDVYFVNLAVLLSTDIAYVESPVYDYRWNERSVVREEKQSVLYAAHLWARCWRFYLGAVRENKPELLTQELQTYLLATFFRTQLFAPSDEAAFWAENQHIYREFVEVWPSNLTDLQQKAEKAKSSGNWGNSSTVGLSEFVAKFSGIKKLAIVIPFMGQTEAELMLPLASLNAQLGVDFKQIEIHLVNDAGASIDVEKFAVLSNLTLIYHELTENVGAGLARQYGIDHSNSDYLMFVDADDALYNNLALHEFFRVMKEAGPHDLFVAQFVEQFKNPAGGYFYTTHGSNDVKSVYAKCYRRSYIERVGLRFHPDLRVNEDLYFVHLACLLTSDICHIELPVYIWLCNPTSTVRADDRAFAHQTHLWAHCHRLLLEKIAALRPELVASHLDGYAMNAFFLYSNYPPRGDDDAAFWQENAQLWAEFGQAWQGYRPELQAMAEAEVANPQSLWHGRPIAGFREFMQKSGF